MNGRHNTASLAGEDSSIFWSMVAVPNMVLHSCDNPLCCNPKHLSNGTVADNSRDMVERDRQAKGEKNGRAKLSDDAIRDIRDLFRSGSTKRKIARLYAVSDTLIRYIVCGKNWTHVK